MTSSSSAAARPGWPPPSPPSQLGLDYLVVEKGVAGQLHLPLSDAHGVLHHAGAARDRRPAADTPYDKPTRLEALRYYRRVVDTYQLQISFHEAVTAIDAVGDGDERVFAVTTTHGARRDAACARRAPSCWRSATTTIPNRLGVPGEDLPHVSHYYDEAHPYYRQRVVDRRRQELGGRGVRSSSFAPARMSRSCIATPTLGDSIKYWVQPDIENRIKEGSVAARFEPTSWRSRRRAVVVDGARRAREETSRRGRVPADRLSAGYRSDATAPASSVDPETLAPLHRSRHLRDQRAEPVHRRRRVAGRQTGNIFIENGRFHGEQVAKALAERLRNAYSGRDGLSPVLQTAPCARC